MYQQQVLWWYEAVLGRFLLPIVVAITTYVLVRKLDEWKKRKGQSVLGEVILDTLIEEVTNGLNIMRAVASGSQQPSTLLPRMSWDGMTTVPDDVLLRIIETARSVAPIAFPPREIRTHCKNYFKHMCPNWDAAVNEDPICLKAARRLATDGGYIEAADRVLRMLEQAKGLLAANAKRWLPK